MEQVAVFCDIDDFCKAYEEYCMHSLMMEKQRIIPKTRMALSEIMTILIMYHLSGYRTFKWYYTKYVMVYQKKDYPNLVSYNRFVEIMEEIPLAILLQFPTDCLSYHLYISFRIPFAFFFLFYFLY